MSFVSETHRRFTMIACQTNRQLNDIKNSVVQSVTIGSKSLPTDETTESPKDAPWRRMSNETQKKMVQHELLLRTQTLIDDREEFRRMQAQIRKSGLLTGVGALQVLDRRATRKILVSGSARSA